MPFSPIRHPVAANHGTSTPHTSRRPRPCPAARIGQRLRRAPRPLHEKQPAPRAVPGDNRLMIGRRVRHDATLGTTAGQDVTPQVVAALPAVAHGPYPRVRRPRHFSAQGSLRPISIEERGPGHSHSTPPPVRRRHATPVPLGYAHGHATASTRSPGACRTPMQHDIINLSIAAGVGRSGGRLPARSSRAKRRQKTGGLPCCAAPFSPPQLAAASTTTTANIVKNEHQWRWPPPSPPYSGE